MTRALGGLHLDLIRDGVPDLADAYGAEFDRLVYSALVRTAMAAQGAGYDFARWSLLVDEPGSHLGRQLGLHGGRKRRSLRSYQTTQRAAWDRASERTGDGFALADRLAFIARVRDFVADPHAQLTDNERAVLGAAVTLAEHHQHTRPACPRARLVELSGLGERAVRTALTGLDRKGLLVLAQRGVQGEPGKRKAALYRLPGEEALASHRCRETGPMGPRTEPMGPPTQTTVQEDAVNLSELARARAELEALKAELKAELIAELGLTQPETPDNVRHLRVVKR